MLQHIYHAFVNLNKFFGEFMDENNLVVDSNKSRGCFVVMVMVHNIMLVMVVPLEYIRYFSVNGRHVSFVVLEDVKKKGERCMSMVGGS